MAARDGYMVTERVVRFLTLKYCLWGLSCSEAEVETIVRILIGGVGCSEAEGCGLGNVLTTAGGQRGLLNIYY